MKKCLVLGANGFIGNHLVLSLAQAGYKVTAFDRHANPDNFKNQDVKLVAGDFLNRDDLRKALKGIDYVFHFISTTTPFSADNDPLIDIETNVRMSVVLFQECVKSKVSKVIFPSSGGSIYGANSSNGVNEEVLPKPISPYAIGKLSIEHYLRYFNLKHGLESVVYRISNTYGEGQSLDRDQGVIPIFLDKISNNEPITIYGDGSMIRDYIYVKDVADLITSSFEKAQQPLYNLGSGEGISLLELVEKMKQVTGSKVKIIHKENPVTFVNEIVLDTKLFQKEFNMPPAVLLEEGIARTWGYYKSL